MFPTVMIREANVFIVVPGRKCFMYMNLFRSPSTLQGRFSNIPNPICGIKKQVRKPAWGHPRSEDSTRAAGCLGLAHDPGAVLCCLLSTDIPAGPQEKQGEEVNLGRGGLSQAEKQKQNE